MADKTYLKTTLAIVAISVLLAQITFAAPPRYEIVDLGTIGGDQSAAKFINDHGQIVGSAYNQQGERRATLFDSTGNGNNIDLGTLGGTTSWVWSINNSGQIVGFAENQQGYGRATLFDPTGSGNNIDLGTLGELRSNALAINNSGQIVGSARNVQGYQRATLFDPTGGGNNIDLGTLGGTHSQAWSINDSGQIVGKARIPRGYSHATLFDPTGGGNNIDLGTLGGSSSNVHSINNIGQIVGWAANDSLDNRACLFDPTGGGNNIELGTLGGRLSWALSINDLGQIVGAADDQQMNARATLFDPTGNGNNIDLNTIVNPGYGWILTNAFCINNHGWIVGNRFNKEGQGRAFLMKPLPRTIYVDDDAAGANDGSSWADAFNYLQDALTAAWSGDEIHVAQGTYKPDQGVGITPGDREATFQLKNGVTIKGGYAGEGTPDPNARDIQLYETILSGDLNSNDIKIANPKDLEHEPSRAENSYHVVTGSGCDGSAALDGFTITGGNANGSYWSYGCGGGICNVTGSPTLTNCKFVTNVADDGGGMYNHGYDGECTPILINCVFSGNFAGDEDGGGMYNRDSNPTLTNCTFSGNEADDDGGGMYNSGSSPILTDCTFNENSVFGSGGGMENRSGSNPTLTNCTFIGNSANYDGGGMGNRQDSNPTLTGCTFSGNLATNLGGGMWNKSGGNPTLTGCTFSENSAYTGAGMGNQESNPILKDCKFNDNVALAEEGSFGGGMYNDNSSPVLTNCIFTRNMADVLIPDHGGGEGGGIYNERSNPALTNCAFTENKALCGGGGMANDFESSPTLNNCIFTGNLAIGRSGRWGDGGAILNEYSTPAINNCTFSGNSASRSGGGMFNSYSHTMLTNCIFWGDTPEEIHLGYVGTALITYSNVQGDWPGIGNIDADPLFFDLGYWDANGVWIDGDYHLLAGSPCIDTGDPNYVAEPNETDLDGRPRVIGGRIDMGAYETPIFAEARILPRTINLASMGNWITCYISLPEDYNVADIEPNSVFLEDEIQAESLKVDEKQQVATARFTREDVQTILEVGDINMTITGRLTDGTIFFEGTDTIKVINKGRNNK